ncbi:rhodanese-like domain-containing protein [Sedimenticola hydrogenitrophicus]|uniref:rhodanese-like domain-containing protein n=1 Tax=Sedimenticola hydrogenitrophicus TaxID=2967975 RepID=UPI0023B00CA1
MGSFKSALFIIFFISGVATATDTSVNHINEEIENSPARVTETSKLPYTCILDPASDDAVEVDSPGHPSVYWDIPDSNDSNRCLVRLASIQRALWDNKIKVVDVRPSQLYRLSHIPNSINIPEYAIRTKSYLTTERLLLVNDGQNYESIIKTCQRLKKSGFKDVSVLIGGISLWAENGKAIVTDPDAPGLLGDQISPRELLYSQNRQMWLFLTNDADVQAVKWVVQSEYVFPLHLNASQLRTRIQSLSTGNDLRVPVNIVVVTHSGERPKPGVTEEIHKLNPVFFLQGGLAGYKQYLTSRGLQLAKSRRGPLVRQGCKI